MPGRVRRDLPGRLRRLQLLPVPQPRLLADGSSTSVPAIAPVRLQGPRGDHRRGLAGPCPVRDPRRTVQRVVPRCPAVRAPVRRPAGALPGPGRHPDLRVRDDPARASSPRRASSPDGSTPSSGPCRAGYRYAVEIRNPEYLGPGLLRHARRGTASRTSFNAWTRMPRPRRPGRDARGLHGRFHGRPGAAPAPGGPTSRPSPASRRTAPSASPTRRRATPSSGSPIGLATSGKPAYVFVNNRLEGHAPSTIEAVAEALEPGR